MNVDAIGVIAIGALFVFGASAAGKDHAGVLSRPVEAGVRYARWFRGVGIAMVLGGVLMLVT